MYKEILKDKEAFWKVPTILVTDSITQNENTRKGMLEYLRSTDEYSEFLSKMTATRMYALSHKTRELYEEFILNCVSIETDFKTYSLDMETNLYNLIYWSLDMVDWVDVTTSLITKDLQ